MVNYRLINICKTFFSIISINIIIIFFKFYKKKKIIFFYHPRKKLTLNHLNYLNHLFFIFKKDYLIIHGHGLENYNDKNFFFLSQSFLIKWLFNIDVFFSLNVCEKFPIRSKKIYMHHDISTAPLVNNKNEKQLYKRLIKYDYIFIPNKKSQIMFENLFIKYKKQNSEIPKVFCVGYFKLDYLINKFKKHKNLKKQIIIAPSDYRHIKKLSILHNLKKIIKTLLNETKYKIIFRPYPANRNSDLIQNIEKEFINEKNFMVDSSDDYFDIYSNSFCMISDISGTAFTYAFMTNRPVIFYSKNEKNLFQLGYSHLDYFKDRKKVGLIAKDTKQIIKNISKIKNGYNEIKKTNRKLIKEINYLGKSRKIIKKLTDNIVSIN